jgi:nucleoside-diphosphate kinase
MEQTLVIVKPDAVGRGLTGEIIRRLEAAGLELVKLQKVRAERSVLEQHYTEDEAWLAGVGQKTLDDYQSRGVDAASVLGTADAVAIGRRVRGWLIDFMMSGDVVLASFEGNRASDAVRKLIGSTLPVSAAPGTIRGDFSTDSPEAANAELRPVRNLIHASDGADEAARELKLWFGDD